jgi:hypothetical protein
MHLFLPQVLYTVWCTSKLYTDTVFVKTICRCFEKKRKKEKTIGVKLHVPLALGVEFHVPLLSVQWRLILFPTVCMFRVRSIFLPKGDACRKVVRAFRPGCGSLTVWPTPPELRALSVDLRRCSSELSRRPRPENHLPAAAESRSPWNFANRAEKWQSKVEHMCLHVVPNCWTSPSTLSSSRLPLCNEYQAALGSKVKFFYAWKQSNKEPKGGTRINARNRMLKTCLKIFILLCTFFLLLLPIFASALFLSTWPSCVSGVSYGPLFGPTPSYGKHF